MHTINYSIEKRVHTQTKISLPTKPVFFEVQRELHVGLYPNIVGETILSYNVISIREDGVSSCVIPTSDLFYLDKINGLKQIAYRLILFPKEYEYVEKEIFVGLLKNHRNFFDRFISR